MKKAIYQEYISDNELEAFTAELDSDIENIQSEGAAMLDEFNLDLEPSALEQLAPPPMPDEEPDVPPRRQDSTE